MSIYTGHSLEDACIAYKNAANDAERNSALEQMRIQSEKIGKTTFQSILRVLHEPLALDIAINSALKVVAQKLDDGDEVETQSFNKLFLGIVSFRLRDQLKQQKLRGQHETQFAIGDNGISMETLKAAPEQSTLVVDQEEGANLTHTLISILDNGTPKDKSLFTARLEGKGYNEIADEHNMKPGTTKSALSHMKTRLREAIHAELGEQSPPTDQELRIVANNLLGHYAGNSR